MTPYGLVHASAVPDVDINPIAKADENKVTMSFFIGGPTSTTTTNSTDAVVLTNLKKWQRSRAPLARNGYA